MTTQPIRSLGATGLKVTAICVGCAELGDMPETFAYGVPEPEALATIRTIFAGPFTFIDTAASYGDGESERRIGLVLRELGSVPANFVVATKADRNLSTGDFSGAQMRRSVERSLTLLGLDTLPICYLHDPEHIGFEAAMAADVCCGGLFVLYLRSQRVCRQHSRWQIRGRSSRPFWCASVGRAGRYAERSGTTLSRHASGHRGPSNLLR